MIEADVLDQHQDPSLGHYLKEWLAHARGRVRATTYAGYEYLIRCHAVPALGEVPLSELSPLHFQRLYSSLLVSERHLSAGTVLNLHLVLSQALGQAVRWGICEQNPVKGAQPPRPVRPEPVAVDPSLAKRIVAALSGSAVELPGCSRSRPGYSIRLSPIGASSASIQSWYFLRSSGGASARLSARGVKHRLKVLEQRALRSYGNQVPKLRVAGSIPAGQESGTDDPPDRRDRRDLV
jgi:hypothetical protein